MNSVFAKTMYTGKSVIKAAFLAYDGQKITGITKKRQGKGLRKKIS